ncbi:MAG: methylated-DNA--[protein]-cysteine S-methyltransferase [Anaerolineales bacterium]|nr:methylated-DNA--[protein]-cysteine S-methyltransferase [Anaerolineales bacterium]
MTNQTLSPKQTADYARVARAIQYLAANFRQQPSLDDVAASVHLSKYHFQRLFTRWAGISPSQFLRYLTIEYAKAQLQTAASVLEVSLDAGLSGPGRLHDLFVTFAAMSPGEFKQHGAGLTVQYGLHPTPFGLCLIATTPRGICALRFADPAAPADLLAELAAEWPQAQLTPAPDATAALAAQIFDADSWDTARPFPLHLKGTNFQVQVWQALLRIPAGARVSYQDVAAAIGRPTATRAVAAAIARNPVGYLIPCHRVISRVGQAHHYRWGSTRKQAMLGWEAARAHPIRLSATHPLPAASPE